MNYGRQGFTLIEVLITVAIVTTISLVGYVGFSKFKGSQAVELTTSEVAAVIKDAQKKAVTQQDGKQWGIRFKNSNSSYEVFSGPSYASGTVSRTYYLGRNTVFGNPATSTIDEVFSAISGKLAETRVISLIDQRKDGVVGDIVLTSRGTITTRKESGLVGYWHLDEATSATAYDSSGFTNTGTLYSSSTVCGNPPTAGCPTWQSSASCKAGPCLSFDGVDDYIQLSNLAVNTGSGQQNTVAFWMYWNGTNADMPFGFTSYDLYLVSGAFGFNHGCGDVWGVSSTGLANRWVHVAAVFYNNDYTKEQLYLDGVPQTLSQRVGTSCNRSVSTSAKIATWQGSCGSGGLYCFGGNIDEVRIYNRALSAAEVLNLYNDLK